MVKTKTKGTKNTTFKIVVISEMEAGGIQERGLKELWCGYMGGH